jgi:hypothetical protein
MSQLLLATGNAAIRLPRSRVRPGKSSSELPLVWSSADWVKHFCSNIDNRLAIPWESGAGATAAELSRIADSLRAWQLGETSDGAHLMAVVRKYAASMHDPDSIEAIRLFILEEQRPGDHLGRFLDMAGIPRAKRDWGDSLFRAARYFVPRMEVWVTPVVMVETHALIYYNAIRLATASPVLRQMCRQILVDEIPHIRFQCERLAILHRRRHQLFWLVTMAIHRLFFTATTIAIWVGHREALRAGGYSFGRFWKAAWGKMNRAWRMMDPKAYRWKPEESGEWRVKSDKCGGVSELLQSQLSTLNSQSPQQTI